MFRYLLIWLDSTKAASALKASRQRVRLKFNILFCELVLPNWCIKLQMFVVIKGFSRSLHAKLLLFYHVEFLELKAGFSNLMNLPGKDALKLLTCLTLTAKIYYKMFPNFKAAFSIFRRNNVLLSFVSHNAI